MSLFLRDLPDKVSGGIKVGSTIYLIRKVSNHVLETELIEIGRIGRPNVEVKWLSNGAYKYRLDLENNLVLALNESQRHRQEMKRWYTVWEPQRKLLIETFHRQAKTSGK